MPTWLDKILNSQFVMIGLAGLAFLIALWLVIVIVRMLTGGRLRMNSGRTRQARLGIVDAFDLDRQRQLIIVRRDNTEHLIMIGGPNDLLIEAEIVRVESRENRRLADKIEGPAENRIPAPTMSPDAAPAGGAEEPLLPMSMPRQFEPERGVEPGSLDDAGRGVRVAPEQVRPPTFPLPPRRPAPLPERRPPPLPQSASRSDERPSEAAGTAPPISLPLPVARQAEPEVQAPSADAPAPPQGPPPEQREEAVPRPALRTPPSFLKPLPPRPPIRPLRRATPVVPGASAQGAEGPSPAATPPAEPTPAAPQVAEPVPAAPIPTPPPAPTPAPAAEAPEPKPGKADEANALESLEEEMAKLLGRG